MTDAPDNSESPAAEAMPSTVAHGILESFFKELAETEGFGDTADRLRKVVLVDGSFAEKAIHSAIFDETAS